MRTKDNLQELQWFKKTIEYDVSPQVIYGYYAVITEDFTDPIGKNQNIVNKCIGNVVLGSRNHIGDMRYKDIYSIHWLSQGFR